MRLLLASALILSASAAQAQLRELIDPERILYVDLPHGQVEISRVTVGDAYGYWAQTPGTVEVILDGDSIPQWIETHENSALLRLYMGTAACGVMYAWITLDENGLRSSGTFGTCAYEGVYEVTEEGASYTMENTLEGDPTITYVLDPVSGQVSNFDAPWK
ncbi:hypothetical protein HOY34_10990 [Xinfangfangia sp. D13-10-4-6]|uniref:hypothetical protein n=1 Tax=Pseudogemmobacter hezensis TaxID=2737662 RepID=UPI001553B26A|nr:hypothetical protein [Pseudogemmobacter hezensis]NPD15727.1 hypothetical protein [Pseudogemmobacter hezensis]